MDYVKKSPHTAINTGTVEALKHPSTKPEHHFTKAVKSSSQRTKPETINQASIFNGQTIVCINPVVIVLYKSDKLLYKSTAST